MAYKSSIYLQAKQALDARRAQAEQLMRRRHDEVAARCPALETIERDMAACGAELVRLALSGKELDRQLAELSSRNLEMQKRRAALLTEAGYPADYLENVYHCPVCKDTGTHNSFLCQCYLDLITETAKNSIKGAAQLRKCTFESFDLRYYSDTPEPSLGGVSPRQIMERAVTYLKKYAKAFSRDSKSILMIGKTGLGKTHLSLAVANVAIERRLNVYYDSAQGILDRLEQAHFSHDTENEALQEDLYESDLLIIDDLGSEVTNSLSTSLLSTLVTARFNSGLPIIFSTNLGPGELESTYSQRFASRLLGNCEQLRFYGKDIRAQKANGK